MLRSYGAFLFLRLIIPPPGKATAKKNRRRAVLLVVCQWELWYNTLDTL